jgi:hypothetical protein
VLSVTNAILPMSYLLVRIADVSIADCGLRITFTAKAPSSAKVAKVFIVFV